MSEFEKIYKKLTESLDREFGKKGLSVMINSWIRGLQAGKTDEVIEHMKEIANKY